MKISLVQFAPSWENKSASMNTINKMLNRKSNLGEAIIFPEMTLTGFTMNAKNMAEDFNGQSLKFFASTAIKHKINVFIGIIEKSRSSYFNSLIHLDKSGSIKAGYRKIHPFSYSTEDKYYQAGDKVVTTAMNNWKIGLSICYDLRFPELFRFFAKAKVDLIINIANWPNTRIEHWRTLLKARAIENQCYVAGVNRVGNDPKLLYKGYSSVFDPMGKEIVSMKDKEQTISVDIDKNLVETVRKKLPFLNDIRLI